MLADRKRDAALAFLDNLLREGEEPVANRRRAGVAIPKADRSARDCPLTRTAIRPRASLAMRPEAAETAVRQAHRIPKKDLLAGLVALAEADSQLKSSNPNPRALMEFLIARLTLRSAA